MRYLLACFLFMAFAADSAFAQNLPPIKGKERPKSGYVHFDFDSNVEALVKDRLKMEHDLDPFKDLVKQILANPEKFAFDPQKFKDAKLDDPAMKEAVRKWLDEDPKLKQDVGNWFQKLPANKKTGDVDQLNKKLQSIIQQDSPPRPNPPTSDGGMKGRRADAGVNPAADPLAKAAEHAMQQAQQGELAKWLSESPGWKRALEELQSSMKNPDGSRWQMGDWQKRFGFDEQKAWQFGADTFRRLQNMPRPHFEGTHWKPTLPGVGALPTLNFGPPALPTYRPPSLPSLGASTTWLFLLLLTLIAGWQLLRWTKRTPPPADARAALGPWPILPGAVSSRADLVQAFDYLALRTLGYRVSSWNHQAVAQRWSHQVPALEPIARALAGLYEASRYTEGSEELATPQRDQARHALTQIAEALG